MADDARTILAGLIEGCKRIGRRPAGGNGDQAIARTDAGTADIPARQIHVILVAAGEIAQARGTTGEQNNHLVERQSIGAGQFKRIGHGHQSGASSARIDKAPTGGQAIGGNARRRRNRLDRCFCGPGRSLLTDSEKTQRLRRMYDIQASCLVVTLFGLG